MSVPLPVPVQAIIFDLDGTIYLGDSLVTGAAELVDFLLSRSIKVFYCTNNSSRTRQEICRKLADMGLPALPEQMYSAAYATARYIAEAGIREVFCFGAQGLQAELKSFGIDLLAEPGHADTVVIGLDTSLDYRRIAALLPLRGKPCRLIACNRDTFFPANNGMLMPGCGFIVSMVELALGAKIDHVVGKPGDYMISLLLREHELSHDEIVVVGDSLESDIGMAKAVGCRSIYLSRDGADIAGVEVVNTLEAVQGLVTPELCQ